jgi:hypothetical protein
MSFVSVVKRGADWHMLYYGAQVGLGVPFVNYASSTDGISWTKPILGNVIYGGNTDNNIVQIGVFTSCRYVAAIDKWVLTTETDTSGGNTSLYIYTADSPQGPYTLAKQLSTTGYHEGKEVIRRPDGRWVAFYTSNQSTNLRRVSAWLSDTTDLSGAWTRYTYVIPVVVSSNQPYGLGVELVGDAFLALLMVYDSTDGDGSIRMDLWASRTGVNDWGLLKQNWIPLGGASDFDRYMVINGSRFTEDGNSWHVYYCGAPNGHEAADTFYDREIGRATLGRRRVVGWSGSGSLVTSAFTVIEGGYTSATMAVNADASGGSLSIELRDGDGATIPGYSFADFDTITTDVYDATPTWGGQPFPAAPVVSVAFVLNAASLYGYTITRS